MTNQQKGSTARTTAETANGKVVRCCLDWQYNRGLHGIIPPRTQANLSVQLGIGFKESWNLLEQELAKQGLIIRSGLDRLKPHELRQFKKQRKQKR